MCMCGITGCRLEGRPFKSTCYFKKMANSIQHRGPDAEGFWFSPHAALHTGV